MGLYVPWNISSYYPTNHHVLPSVCPRYPFNAMSSLEDHLIFRQPQPPPDIPPYHIAIHSRFGDCIRAIGIERLPQHAGVEETI